MRREEVLGVACLSVYSSFIVRIAIDLYQLPV